MEMLAATQQAPVGPPPQETHAGVRLQTPHFYAQHAVRPCSPSVSLDLLALTASPCFGQNDLSTVQTLTFVLVGTLCGLLNLQGLSGFLSYLAVSGLLALGIGFSPWCKGKPARTFVGGWAALMPSQDGFLAFL